MTRTAEEKQALNDVLQRGVDANDQDMMRLSLEKGADADMMIIGLTNRGTLEKMQNALLALALKKGADSNLLLFAAIQRESVAVAKIAVEQGGADVNCTHNPPGKTDVYPVADWSYQKFNSGVSDYLISKGMDVNARNNSGATPLLRAVNDAHYVKTVHYLGHGANPLVADNAGKFPLQALQRMSFNYGSALGEKRDEVLKAMLKNVPDDASDAPAATPQATFNAVSTQEDIEVTKPIELKKKTDPASGHKGFQL
jgi:hypothetical protein